jgi:thiamine pyrophosphate-dependent acetolactate synthase large subunit-like protein
VTKEVLWPKDRRSWPYDVRKAFRIAKASPPGPVAVITDPSLPGPMDLDQLMWWCDRDKMAFLSPPAGDPDEMEKIVDWVLKAERPMVIAGDGCYWLKAGPELMEFAELLQVSVNGRRTAAGIIPETHYLALASGWRGRAMLEADLIILLGLREGTTEGNMFPPPMGLYRRDINYIQINESPLEFADFLPTLSMSVASPKLSLRQMINIARDRLKGKKVDRAAWLEYIGQNRKSFWAHVAKAAAEDKQSPVGGHVFGKIMGEFYNDLGKYILVQDSFSGATAASNKCLALEPGTALDAAPGFPAPATGCPWPTARR